ncbi:MAG TPA: hypothetical protein PKD74_02265 [Candidatus Dependentiae bacterium]|nr:hypothetical protein [Candidatus Dependentiae bacterium]
MEAPFYWHVHPSMRREARLTQDERVLYMFCEFSNYQTHVT